MESIVEFLKALGGLPTSVAIIAVCLLAAYMIYNRWVKFKEGKETLKDDRKLEEVIKNVNKHCIELNAKVGNVETGTKEMASALMEFVTKHSAKESEQTAVLQQIHKQLLDINSSTAKYISSENAKLIVENGWGVCRAQTIKAILNSISNNHFRNQEERVARGVFRAWNKACSESINAADRFDGMKYPYQHLYTQHILLVWELAWGWAIPIYYMDRGDAESFSAALCDLEMRITSLFDQIYQLHVELVEDVDVGIYYDDNSGSRPATAPSDLTIATNMADRLSYYKPRAGSKVVNPTQAEIKERLLANIKNHKNKVRSSCEIPAV